MLGGLLRKSKRPAKAEAAKRPVVVRARYARGKRAGKKRSLYVDPERALKLDLAGRSSPVALEVAPSAN